MTLFKRPCDYSKMNKEDPEELIHRRAKFLIYKKLQEADLISHRSPPSLLFLRMKIFRLKVMIGNSLANLHRSIASTIRFGGIRKHSQGGLRAFKKMFHGGATTGLHRPIFTLEVWFIYSFVNFLLISLLQVLSLTSNHISQHCQSVLSVYIGDLIWEKKKKLISSLLVLVHNFLCFFKWIIIIHWFGTRNIIFSTSLFRSFIFVQGYE